jgi:hypothetical protein
MEYRRALEITRSEVSVAHGAGEINPHLDRKIGYPTSAKAYASRLQRMNRVVLFAIVFGDDRKRVASRCRNKFRPSTQACARSYSLPIRLTTQSASRCRSMSFRTTGRNTRTGSAFSST